MTTATGSLISYSYDADGIRSKKVFTGQIGATQNVTTHNYITQNGKIVRDTITSGNTTKVLDFIYDASGKPFALNYSVDGATPTTYYYILNLQGDVVQLRTADGTVAATYTYDAWGKVISYSGTMAGTNPLRYRGYYCDTETGFYYLQSRYYDPELHRFINADSLASTGQGFLGTNVFAYCLNNPTKHIDLEGKDAVVVIDTDGVGHVGIVVQDEEGNWWHFYWGLSHGKTRLAAALFHNRKPLSWCVELEVDEISLEAINSSGQYADGTYDSYFYYEGDFSKIIDEMKNPTGSYNLYFNNCVQVSLGLLAKAETKYQDAFTFASREIVPLFAKWSLLLYDKDPNAAYELYSS